MYSHSVFASSVFVKIRFNVRALVVEMKMVPVQPVLQEQLKALKGSRGVLIDLSWLQAREVSRKFPEIPKKIPSKCPRTLKM